MTTSGVSRRWLQAGTLAAGLGAALAAGTGTACADDDPTWPGDSRPWVSSHSEKPSARGDVAQAGGRVAASSRAGQCRKPAPATSAGARTSGVSASAVVSRTARSQLGVKPISAAAAPAYPAALAEPVAYGDPSFAMCVDGSGFHRCLPARRFRRLRYGPVEQLWFGVRRFEYTFFNDYPTAKPVQTAQDTDGTITGSVQGLRCRWRQDRLHASPIPCTARW